MKFQLHTLCVSNYSAKPSFNAWASSCLNRFHLTIWKGVSRILLFLILISSNKCLISHFSSHEKPSRGLYTYDFQQAKRGRDKVNIWENTLLRVMMNMTLKDQAFPQHVAEPTLVSTLKRGSVEIILIWH